MERISFEEFEARAALYDEAVLRSFALDRFCSSSFWLLPAVRHFTPDAGPRIYQEGGSWLVLAESSSFWHPLEASWGLACPLVGESPEAAVDLFLRGLDQDPGWDAVVVTGLVPAGALWERLLPEVRRRYQASLSSDTRRYAAFLGDGLDEYLRRRSPGFRRNVERSQRRAARRGLRFEIADETPAPLADESFERILKVERRSWKGLLGVGIENEPMCSFYREMNRRLVQRGRRRLSFARLDGEDVAYILGAVFGNAYRGLQFSFDARFASLSLGNLCQIEEIRRLANTGIRSYDLGTEVPYKKSWGDEVMTTRTLVLRRHS